MEQRQPILGQAHCSCAATVHSHSNCLVLFTTALGLDLFFRDKIRLSWFLNSRDWFLISQVTPSI
jgi:hypothetical protein